MALLYGIIEEKREKREESRETGEVECPEVGCFHP
jgi:hypothetical protein